jgi:hypothetical protein
VSARSRSVDRDHDPEAPDRDAGHGRQEVGVAEAGPRRCTAHEVPERGGGQPGQHQHDDRDDQVGHPRQELLQHLRHRRQPERIEGDHQHDQPDEPADDGRQEPGRVGRDAHLLDEIADASPAREVVEAHRPQQRSDAGRDQAGDEPADQEDDGEAEDARHGGEQERHRCSQRCLQRLPPVSNHCGTPPRYAYSARSISLCKRCAADQAILITKRQKHFSS